MSKYRVILAQRADWRIAFALSMLLLLIQSCAGMGIRDSGDTGDGGDISAESTVKTPEVADVTPDEEGAGEVPAQSLSQSMLYDILLAEIAGQRGRLDVSVPHYLQAAYEAKDPRVAERAVRIATYGKQNKVALSAARRWVELDPENQEAHKVLAALALHMGEHDEALEHLDYVVTSTDGSAESYQMVTSVLAQISESGAAMGMMDELVSRHSGDAQAWLAYSRLALHNGQLSQAMDSVDMALSLQPDLTPAIITKTRLLIMQGQHEAASQQIAEGVRKNPDDSDLRLAYARFLVEQKQIYEAKAQFRELLKQTPDDSEALYALGLLELQDENLTEAEAYFTDLLKTGEKTVDAQYYLGYIASARGDKKAAIDWYNRIEEGERWFEAQVRVVELMVAQGEIESARGRLDKLRRANPKLAIQLYLVEADILVDAGYSEEAYQLYSEVLSENPDNTDILYARSLLAERMDRLEDAERDMRHILSIDPDDSRTLNALGYTLADRTDRYDEALVYIEQALAMEPEDPAILDSMGWVQYRLGNLDVARDYLQRAYDMTGDGEIGAHLGEVLWMMNQRDAARSVWEESSKNAPDNQVLRDAIKRFQP